MTVKQERNTWTDEDQVDALNKGWGIFLNTSSDRLEIMRYDEDFFERFPTDDSVISHLFYKARYENDSLAIKAFGKLGVIFDKLKEK